MLESSGCSRDMSERAAAGCQTPPRPFARVISRLLSPSTASSTPAMASLHAAKKYATLAPTVRSLASGVPAAPSVNLAARAGSAGHGHDHAHGAVGPRSDLPSRWAGGLKLASSGLVNQSYTTGKPAPPARPRPKERKKATAS